MNENLVSLLGLVFLAFLIATASCWIDVAHTPLAAWVVFPAGAVLSFGTILWAKFRPDRAPDFLRRESRGMFENNGFCLAIKPRIEGRRFFCDVFFQNRFDAPRRARVTLQPGGGFWLHRAERPTLVIPVDCEAGAYGVVEIPLGIPGEHQGALHGMVLAVNVERTAGRGRKLRFKACDPVKPAKTPPPWSGVARTLGEIASAPIKMPRGASVLWSIPTGLDEYLDDSEPIRTRVLWRLGDPPTVHLDTFD